MFTSERTAGLAFLVAGGMTFAMLLVSLIW